MATAFVTCPLCEATCGLAVEVDGRRVQSVRPDKDDVFSRGFICPKGVSLKELHDDPDRLSGPLVKRDGEFVEVSWDDAFAEIDRRLPAIRTEHGNDSVAVYLGNPGAHNLGSLLYGRALYKALATHNIYTAGTVDQVPKHFSSGYLFGDGLTIPIPDLDRTHYLLLLGANPLVSNGSLMTAPDARGRLRAIRERGGKIVVVDPRRTLTAEAADEHLAIRPGTDALFLAALAQVLFAEGLVSLDRLAEHVSGVDEVGELVAPFRPDVVAPITGIAADVIVRIARDLAAAPSAAVYGRIGTTTQSFGTLASWLVDVLNVLTGNLDRPGGAMFPLGAAGQANATPGRRRAFTHGRFRSRVRDLPEVMGELPVATLADEILTPGDGPGARAHHGRRQPVPEHAQRRTAQRGARRARLHGLARRLPERDVPARRRDPARPAAVRPRALRPGLLPTVGAQRRQLVAAGHRHRPAAGVGDDPAPRRRRHRAGPVGRRRRARRLRRRRSRRAARVSTSRLPATGAARPGSST